MPRLKSIGTSVFIIRILLSCIGMSQALSAYAQDGIRGRVLDVLKHSPGISVNNKGDISLAALGGTAIYVNGRKLMLQGDELSTYLRTLSSEKIPQIDISHNPDASFGADGSGGIINAQTSV